MKNILFFASFLFSITLTAQVTITSADMAIPNDTFRVSTAGNAQLYNFELTDTNYSWDFSGLIASEQRLEDYVAISATPVIYNLVFMYPAVATLAAKRPDSQVATFSLTDGFNFYKTSSTKFVEVGFGSNIQGASVPVKYQTEDVIYNFPASYGSLDSSVCIWNISVPSLGSVYETRHRVNHVDGWGTVVTPMGSYSCIRIKSIVNQRDSIKYDASPFPIPVIPQNYIEYIWLAPAIGYPVVKATARQGVTQVDYLDVIHSFIGFSEESNNAAVDWKISPNPINDYFVIQSVKGFNTAHLQIFSVDGKLRIDKNIGNLEPIDASSLADGMYFIHIQSGSQMLVKKLIVRKNG